jgi:hypothetical protein
MDLQSAFYVVGIIFMGLMLVLFVVLVIAVLVIRAKVNAIHRHVEERLGSVLSLVEGGSKLVARARKAAKK